MILELVSNYNLIVLPISGEDDSILFCAPEATSSEFGSGELDLSQTNPVDPFTNSPKIMFSRG